MDAKIWHDMFYLGLPIAEKMLRPVFIYIFLIVALRLAGKRELVQLNPFDLVVLLTLANTVQNSIIGDDNSVTGGVIGAATLLVMNFFVVRFLYSHEKLERLVEGNPDALIENGLIHMDRMKKELITIHQLEASAHRQGFASLDDVEQAVLEPGGALCMIAKKPVPEEKRHREVLASLTQITKELHQLKHRTQAFDRFRNMPAKHKTGRRIYVPL